MSLARWEPLTDLRRIRDEMDRMFESVWRPSTLVPWTAEGLSPAIDVYEEDANVMIKAELPGLRREDIEITATEDSVSLRGEFRCADEMREEGFYRRERRMGRFYRTVPMPVAIKPEEVKASFKDGILAITAPRSEAARPKEKKVAIEA